MKFRLLHLITSAAIGLTLALSASAHHSASEFDPKLVVEVTGIVTKLEWKSPHARLYVDVVDENGETVNWNFELPSPNTMMRRGWTRKAVKVGDKVSVTGSRARNFPHIAIARMVTDKDGNPMFTGSTPDY